MQTVTRGFDPKDRVQFGPKAIPALAAAAQEAAPEEDPFADSGSESVGEDLEATRVINLDDLQSGRNYNRG